MAMERSQFCLTKRRRTELEHKVDSELEAIKRDPDLWLPDGNIVVTSRNIAFRVHKSILAHHSEVFCDLFSLPGDAPVAVDDMMDGCQVVALDSDEPADLRHLFLVVCCGKKCVHIPPLTTLNLTWRWPKATTTRTTRSSR